MHTLFHRHIYTHTYKHNYTLTHIYIHLNTYKHMHTYTHIHKQTNTYAQLQILFTHTHAHIHADNTYVHVNKYIHIPVHTYRDVQIHSFIHEHIKKIFDQNILNRKNFSSINIFHSKKICQIDIHAHINTHTNSCKKTLFTDAYQHTHTC